MANWYLRSTEFDRIVARNRFSGLFLLLVVTTIAVWWWVNPSDIVYRMPDATSYIRFDDYRGAGYPLLLDLVEWIAGSLRPVVSVQHILFFLSLAFLGVRFLRYTGSFLLATALIVGLGLNPEFVKYNFTLLTESLFFSSLMLLLGILLSPISPLRVMHLLVCGALIAWLILIKPVAWSLVSIPVLLLVNHALHERRLLTSVLAVLAGFICITAAGSLYRHSVHGAYTPGSFLGNQIIGKLIFAEFDPDKTPYPEAAKLWLVKTDTIRRIQKSEFEQIDKRFLFALNLYDYLRFDQADALTRAMGTNAAQKPELQHRLAMSVLKQDPGTYIDDVLMQLYGLWTMAILQPRSVALQYMEIRNRAQQQLPEDIVLYATEGRIGIVARVLKMLLISIFTIGWIILFAGLYQWLAKRQPLSRFDMTLFICAAAVQSYFLLVAMFQAALARYLFAAWPLLLVFALILAAGILRMGDVRFRQQSSKPGV